MTSDEMKGLQIELNGQKLMYDTLKNQYDTLNIEHETLMAEKQQMSRTYGKSYAEVEQKLEEVKEKLVAAKKKYDDLHTRHEKIREVATEQSKRAKNVREELVTVKQELFEKQELFDLQTADSLVTPQPGIDIETQTLALALPVIEIEASESVVHTATHTVATQTPSCITHTGLQTFVKALKLVAVPVSTCTLSYYAGKHQGRKEKSSSQSHVDKKRTREAPPLSNLLTGVNGTHGDMSKETLQRTTAIVQVVSPPIAV
jgi:vacuolar-type H+-ATPase subunit D/Vma8